MIPKQLSKIPPEVPQDQKPPKKKTIPLQITTLKDIRDLIVSAEGGNIDAQQTLNEFLNFKDDLERSNFPNRSDLRLIAYVAYFSKTLFKGAPDNPAMKLQDVLTSAYNGLGSKKSNQFVELMKQTPDLINLQTEGEPQKRSLRDKLTGRNKIE